MKRLINRNKPKEAIFKALVQDYFLDNPKEVEAIVEIKKHRKQSRSQAQNELYFLWIDKYLRQELGYSKNEMHKALVDELLGYDISVGLNGKEINSLKETKKLTVAQFSSYLEEVDRLAAEMGIILPHPDIYWTAMGIK